MKSFNTKKIAAVVAGATLLGLSFAFAGSVSFQSIPVISNSGQPVVQVVVGSGAAPSDGIAAANIAATIGNLAYTSVPITASVNQSEAAKVLSAHISPSQYSLSNQAVYINSSSIATGPAGTYSFQALIGSVLNRAVKVGPISNTKYLQSYGSDAYYNTGYSTSESPVFSPYVGIGTSSVINSTVSASTNGGGLSFSSFTNSTGDNILRVTHSNLAGLENNAGKYGESEYLFLMGASVYNQKSKSLSLMDANGAYQAVFNKHIALNMTSNTMDNATISLLGQNYTIIKALGNTDSLKVTSTTAAVPGGELQLATSLTPAKTVYVGKNLTGGAFTIQLTDLGQPNVNGTSAASLNIYYNTQLVKTVAQSPGLQTYNISGHNLAIDVVSTFAGLYSYQKYASIELYSGIMNVTSGSVFNKTRDPNWYTKLLWVNSTNSNGKANQLYSIILYGGAKASQNLLPGQSFAFITNPAVYKLSFLNSTGVTYDPIAISTSSAGATSYKNLGGTASKPVLAYNSVDGAFGKGVTGSSNTINTIINDTAISEPMQVLSVSSSIPNAFSYAGQNSKTIVYNLVPYQLKEYNAIDASTFNSANVSVGVIIDGNVGNYINKTNPITVRLSGFKNKQPVSKGFIFNSSSFYISEHSTLFDNITNITLSKVVPGIASVTAFIANTVFTSSIGSIYVNNYSDGLVANALTNSLVVFNTNSNDFATNSIANVVAANLANTIYGNALTYAVLTPLDPVITYSNSNNNENYNLTASALSVMYNQYNGQTPETFALSTTTSIQTPVVKGTKTNYFNYAITEYPVPASTSKTDVILFNIDNSSAGVGASTLFQLNQSIAGAINNLSYTSTQNNKVNAQQGFITERGSQITSIGQSAISLNLAKSVDKLLFMVSPKSVSVTKVSKTYGPFKVGESLTNMGLPNATVTSINASIVISNKNNNVSISGISNLTATPSLANADQVVLLKNLSTNPLVVLDNASSVNPSSNLILIGSGYVNSLSKQVEKAYNITNSNLNVSSGIVQAYGSNRILVAGYSASQTTAAANKFIEDLYAAAATSS